MTRRGIAGAAAGLLLALILLGQSWTELPRRGRSLVAFAPRELAVRHLGGSGAAFDLNRASVSIGSVPLFTSGVPHDERADDAAKVLAAKEMTITVDLGTGGRHDATMWTCDFSADYVRINAEYRT